MGGGHKSLKPPSALARLLRSALPRVEALEDRLCPAGVWEWAGAGGGTWSNAVAGNWLFNGAPAPANAYPGMAGSINDLVAFDIPTAGPATLDVALANPIAALNFSNWKDTLTLNQNLVVQNGTFNLTDGSTITMAAGKSLTLFNIPFGAGNNVWSRGTITGGANSTLHVSSGELDITQRASTLGTNLVIDQAPGVTATGAVVISGMTFNLSLTGAHNYIDVGNGGYLDLYQIVAPGSENLQGGITFPAGVRPDSLAVQIESGGTVDDSPGLPAGTINQVTIAGTVDNLGGGLWVGGGSVLNLDGTDADGDSYDQRNGEDALLLVGSGGNVHAAGSYQIDSGTVKLTAPSGGSADELDGTGLNFGNGENDAALTVVDSTPGTPGTITIQGGVDLSSIATTTLNFSGTNNTADLLDVKNGALVLAGSLDLWGDKKPTKALNFFDDSSATAPPSITVQLDSITDNVGGTDIGRVVPNNAQLLYYRVSFAPPAVGGLAPNNGPMGGGTVVTIVGTYLDDATGVSFGAAPATSFVVNSDGSITAVAPASYSAGTVDVTVTTSEGTSATSSADQFTYLQVPVVMGISPSSGPTTGGTSVTIYGSGLTGATAVYFGGTAASSITVNADGSITAVSPAGSAGIVDVTVVTAEGTSATTTGDQFTYLAAPVVTGVSPSSGSIAGGTSVTISGSGFTGATAIYFGGTSALWFTVNSDGSITVTAPNSFFTGVIDITVVTAAGTSATSSADQFTYT